MTPPGLAQRIKSQLDQHHYFYLTPSNMEAMEHHAGTVHQWLCNHGYTNTTPLMPVGPHGDLISIAADGHTHPMRVDRNLNHLRWICVACQRTGPHRPATDHGADQAGLDMLHHALNHPNCAGEVWLEPVA